MHLEWIQVCGWNTEGNAHRAPATKEKWKVPPGRAGHGMTYMLGRLVIWGARTMRHPGLAL